MNSLYLETYSKLKEHQQSVLDECLTKTNGGIKVPFGFGKTIIGITLGLNYIEKYKKLVLLVVSKTLISSWLFEFEKFFTELDDPLNWPKDDINELKSGAVKNNSNGVAYVLVKKEQPKVELSKDDEDENEETPEAVAWFPEHFWKRKSTKLTVKYEVVSTKMESWEPKIDTQFVLTTPDVLGKYYKFHQIEEKFVEYIDEKQVNGPFTNRVKYYNSPNRPFSNKGSMCGTFYSASWSAIIIDEIQWYTNINTKRCKAISSVYATHRWGLSGSMFSEPRFERFLGYHCLLDLEGMPRNLPETLRLLRSDSFKGLVEHLVYREKNPEFDLSSLEVKHSVIAYDLNKDEQLIYETFKEILCQMNVKAKECKLNKNKEDGALYNSYALAMITYLREVLSDYSIPVKSIIKKVKACQDKSKNDLSYIVLKILVDLSLEVPFEQLGTVKSSRTKKIEAVLDKHKDSKCIVFSTFSSYLDKFEAENKNRTIFKLSSKLSVEQRGTLFKDFETSQPGSVLLSTYALGSPGLNLQCADTVLLSDFWWNSESSKQAVGRVLRPGQKSKTVNVYFFTSNTSIEKIIFEKQHAKEDILDELMHGKSLLTIPKINTNELVKLINIYENEKLVAERMKA